MNSKLELDRLDRRIIEALQQDGRVSLTEIGKRIGLSQPAVSERVQKLHDRGVITGYRAIVDPASVGLPITAFVRLKTGQEHIKPCLDLFRERREITEAHRVSGEDCFVIKVAVSDPAALEQIADVIARFGPVTTSLVFNSYIDRPIAPSGGHAA
ncbi:MULTISPECIES: Lrp/AsnC family transcriptional regulator [unclassified Roseitalea]|uniref:Lrp/AsnC family transcriptional regulator n=1 Tax=unclassified Roseitalea TaxID=2639107 RepID=UPI00273DD8D2|nr:MULTISPECIES: Lrp/AsnC family transcriptional regulator [unclassified Roseitalea]